MPTQKKTLSIHIPTPCEENFQQMPVVKGGKFCGGFEKTIVDFRKMSDRQIIRFYEKNSGKICGVFHPNQLNRSIPYPEERVASSNWKAVAALASSLLLSGGLVGTTLLRGNLIENLFLAT
ncbi:MAG: hypothetical protein AAF960_11970 [Bacteroidota bacterium]